MIKRFRSLLFVANIFFVASVMDAAAVKAENMNVYFSGNYTKAGDADKVYNAMYLVV